MKIEVKIKPFTVNQAYTGRRWKTPSYKIWREEMAWMLKGQKKIVKDGYEIDIEWWSPNYKIMDIDAPIKSILDSIVEAGIISDDRKIDSLFVKKHKGDYKIKIEIK